MSDGKPPMHRRPSVTKITIDNQTYDIPSHVGPATQAQMQSILKSDSPAISVAQTPDQEFSDAGAKRVSFDAEALALA